MRAANDMVEVIREIVRQENLKRDTVVLCQVVGKTGNFQLNQDKYDLAIVPDKQVAIRQVPNMTRFELNVGDFCYVYKIQNNIANAFICYRV